MVAPLRFCAAFLLAALLLCPRASAQLRVTPISPQQNAATPFLFTGRLSVTHGTNDYFGTATFIRRYTALTCGHLLYSGDTGFSTNLSFVPHFYVHSYGQGMSAAHFQVLSGYQEAANADGDSDEAFARDLGYVLFITPAPNSAWADWEANPDLLVQGGPRLVLGYAAETYPGNVMASVTSSAAYALLQDGLYESSDYYTQSGMSGGPVYLFDGGEWQIFAETVAGTSPPEIALSDVRAITAEARPFLIDPEYTQGLVRSAVVTGPSTVADGAAVAYKIGAVFADGRAEGVQLTPRYAELKLVAGGPHKGDVVLTRKKTGKYKVSFAGLAKGDKVQLRVLRDTAGDKDQTPLARFNVTVE